MKTKSIISLFALFAFVLSGSLGFSQKTENREVGSFESISLSISAKVYVSQESSTSLKIKGDTDDLDEIITEVDGSTLKIKRKKASWNFGKSFKKVEVYISSPVIKDIKISGSGNIIAKTPVKTDNVDYAISGSGNIIIDDLKAETVGCHISGSGNIKLKGDSIDGLEVHVSGSGNVDAGYLKAEDVEVHISGSGDCKVHAVEKLNARVSGSGDIYYRGEPKYIDSKTAGSGSIKSVGM